jgi:VanZ family protein
MACALSTVYALTDETHQLFSTGRKFDLWDLVADSIGSTIGATIWTFSRKGSDLGKHDYTNPNYF